MFSHSWTNHFCIFNVNHVSHGTALKTVGTDQVGLNRAGTSPPGVRMDDLA